LRKQEPANSALVVFSSFIFNAQVIKFGGIARDLAPDRSIPI